MTLRVVVETTGTTPEVYEFDGESHEAVRQDRWLEIRERIARLPEQPGEPSRLGRRVALFSQAHVIACVEVK